MSTNHLRIRMHIVTRYRTGSHCLAIEIGRMTNINRNDHVCACGVDLQTIWHIIMQCPITRSLGYTNYHSLQEIFADDNIYNMLLSISNKLKIQIHDNGPGIMGRGEG